MIFYVNNTNSPIFIDLANLQTQELPLEFIHVVVDASNSIAGIDILLPKVSVFPVQNVRILVTDSNGSVGAANPININASIGDSINGANSISISNAWGFAFIQIGADRVYNALLLGGGGGSGPADPNFSIQYNNNGSFYGDAGFTRNPTTFKTDIDITNTKFSVQGLNRPISLILDDATGDCFLQTTSVAEIGDSNNVGNSCVVGVRDFLRRGYLRVLFGETRLGAIDGGLPGNNTGILIDDIAMLVRITNVPTYADDAAALGAGLVTGYLYKTTAGGSTFLKILP